MAASPVTSEELANMGVQELMLMAAIHFGRTVSTNKGELVRQLCKRLGLVVPDPYALTQDPRLRITKQTAEGSDDTAGGPVRSPKKDATKKPYAREQRPQRKNLDTRPRRERHPALIRPPTPGVLNEGTPESSPEPEYRRSKAPLATQEVARDTVEMMHIVQKQMDLLAKENQDVVKKAKHIRAVANELQKQLTAERQRTERLVTYLRYWQNVSGKWDFSSIFPPQDAILRRVDGDTGEIEVDEADAEYDPQLAAFLEIERARNRDKGKGKQAPTEEESMNDNQRDDEAEFAESMEKARELSLNTLTQENTRSTCEQTNSEASGSRTQSRTDYLAEWKKFTVPVRPKRIPRQERTSRYLASLELGPFASFHNEYFYGRPPGASRRQEESNGSSAHPRQPSVGAAFLDSSDTTDSERATRVAPASKQLGYTQQRRPLSRQGSVYLAPTAGPSAAQSGNAGRGRPLSRQESVVLPPPAPEASQPGHVTARRPLSRHDSVRFSPHPAPAATPPRRAGTPRPLSREESFMFEDDPFTEEANGPQASSSSGGGESSRDETLSLGEPRRVRPLTREGGFMVSPPPEAPRASSRRTMGPPPNPISVREQELIDKVSRYSENAERRRARRFDPTPDGRHGRRL